MFGMFCDGAEDQVITARPPFILVLLKDLYNSHITNRDGSETSAVQISAPSSNYADYAQSAVVQGKLHLFGGTTDFKKIARLDDCTIVELPYKLNFDVSADRASSLSMPDNSALICFDINYKLCDIFTGSNVYTTYPTLYSHHRGGLGFYNGQPITVGSFRPDGRRKVETLSSTGWTSLGDSPMDNIGHSLIGVENDLLMIGGQSLEGHYKQHIWRLRVPNNAWNQEQDLKQKVAWGSAIATGNSIFIVGGYDDNVATYSQRIDLDDNDEIAGVQQIGVLGGEGVYSWPALFVATQDYCLSD